MMDPLDELLAKLEPQSQPQTQPKAKDTPAGSGSIDALLQTLDQTTSIEKPRSEVPSLKTTEPAAATEPLLEQVRRQYEQQDQAEAEHRAEAQRQAERQREQQAREKQQRLEQLRAQRRAELTEEAQQWLKQLKPKSPEGRWFEEFACSYASRLEAAIDYLEALSEVNPDR